MHGGEPEPEYHYFDINTELDPEEWECEVVPFQDEDNDRTRFGIFWWVLKYGLAVGAVVFAYAFFALLDWQKKRAAKDEKEKSKPREIIQETASTSTSLPQSITSPLVIRQQQQQQPPVLTPRRPSRSTETSQQIPSRDDMKREASQEEQYEAIKKKYMSEASPAAPTIKFVQQRESKVTKSAKSQQSTRKKVESRSEIKMSQGLSKSADAQADEEDDDSSSGVVPAHLVKRLELMDDFRPSEDSVSIQSGSHDTQTGTETSVETIVPTPGYTGTPYPHPKAGNIRSAKFFGVEIQDDDVTTSETEVKSSTTEIKMEQSTVKTKTGVIVGTSGEVRFPMSGPKIVANVENEPSSQSPESTARRFKIEKQRQHQQQKRHEDKQKTHQAQRQLTEDDDDDDGEAQDSLRELSEKLLHLQEQQEAEEQTDAKHSPIEGFLIKRTRKISEADTEATDVKDIDGTNLNTQPQSKTQTIESIKQKSSKSKKEINTSLKGERIVEMTTSKTIKVETASSAQRFVSVHSEHLVNDGSEAELIRSSSDQQVVLTSGGVVTSREGSRERSPDKKQRSTKQEQAIDPRKKRLMEIGVRQHSADTSDDISGSGRKGAIPPRMFGAAGSLDSLASDGSSGHISNGDIPRPPARRGRRDPDSASLRSQTSLLEVMDVSDTSEAIGKMETLAEVSAVMREAGLESSNLIFGIDYTASNKYQGEESFGGRSLHSISKSIANPYQQVIEVMGRTLAPFASAGQIPVFGFGDVKTSDWSVFPLREKGYCRTFDEVLKYYNRITPKINLSGPTNFAPLIYQAIDICKDVKDYHVLVIVADGQVTNERATRRAIVDACKFPISIIVVGVGDGPWEMMRVFDESLPKRNWDNFHFVEFHKLVHGQQKPDVAFAVESLCEIPDQYKIIKSLGLLDFENFQ